MAMGYWPRERVCLSSGSRKTRIETRFMFMLTAWAECLSSGSRKTRIETGDV